MILNRCSSEGWLGFEPDDRFAPQTRAVGACFRSLSDAQAAAERTLDEEMRAWTQLVELERASAGADARDRRSQATVVPLGEPEWRGTPEATDFSAAAQFGEGTELFTCRVEVRRRLLAAVKAKAEAAMRDAQRVVESLAALEAAPARAKGRPGRK
jgi:hypothetical protein